MITQMLAMLLEISLDAEVLTTNEPLHARELLRERKISLLLTDHLMPQLNGINLIRELRREGNRVPVILLTGYCDEPELTTDAKSLAPFEIITKPWNNEFLLTQIHRALPTT